MQYVNLGRSGLKVSRLCLGTAFRANLFKSDFDEAGCIRTIDHAIAQGLSFVDTANFYSYGRSEEILGRALAGKRHAVVLATKVCSPISAAPGPNDAGLSRHHILREIERSLARLRTDHIDIYWLHHLDENTPIDETLRALDDLIHAGKVRYIGCCNFRAWQLCEALWRSDALHTHAFSAIQNQYSLLNRWEIEPDLIPLCAKYGLGIAVYSPLAVGLLTGRFRQGQPAPAGTPWADNPFHSALFVDYMDARADAIVQALIEIGLARGRTPGQVALAWVLDHPYVSSVIIGPDAPEHIDDALGALDLALSLDERMRLDALSEVRKPLKIA